MSYLRTDDICRADAGRIITFGSVMRPASSRRHALDGDTEAIGEHRVRQPIVAPPTAGRTASVLPVDEGRGPAVVRAVITPSLLQSQCSLDQGEHLSMAYDHIADADVLNATS